MGSVSFFQHAELLKCAMGDGDSSGIAMHYVELAAPKIRLLTCTIWAAFKPGT